MASWWVVPEGAVGQVVGDVSHDITSGLSPNGVGSAFTVKESPTKPVGAAAGPFATQALAQTKANTLNGNVTKATQPSASNLTGLAAIGDFFGRLSEADTWVRVAKVLVGGALLIIGLAHITGADNKAAEIARSVPIVPV